jgi:hypothetical protein
VLVYKIEKKTLFNFCLTWTRDSFKNIVSEEGASKCVASVFMDDNDDVHMIKGWRCCLCNRLCVCRNCVVMLCKW